MVCTLKEGYAWVDLYFAGLRDPLADKNLTWGSSDSGASFEDCIATVVCARTRITAQEKSVARCHPSG
jgi:hypothetical protein